MKRLNLQKYEKLWNDIALHYISHDAFVFIIKNTIICNIFAFLEFFILLWTYHWFINFWFALGATLITKYIFWYFNLNMYFFMFHYLYRNFPEMLDLWDDENKEIPNKSNN